MITKLRLNENDEMSNNETYNQIKRICDKYGYITPAEKFLTVVDFGSDERPYLTLDASIYPKSGDIHDQVIIIKNDRKRGINPNHTMPVSITTEIGSAGTMDISKFENYIANRQNVLNMMKELSVIDFGTLRHIKDEF